MARNKGTFKFAANFEVKAASPLDPRVLVERKSELISKDTWPLDGDTLYVYKGLLVSVQEENAVYMLVDKTKILNEDYSGWKRIDGSQGGTSGGSGEIVDNTFIIEDMTVSDLISVTPDTSLQCDCMRIADAIDSYKVIYIRFDVENELGTNGTGLIPCVGYRDDVYYVSFNLGDYVYVFSFEREQQEILASDIWHEIISGSSENPPQPDWNINDANDPSYIKNRTHYVKEHTLETDNFLLIGFLHNVCYYNEGTDGYYTKTDVKVKYDEDDSEYTIVIPKDTLIGYWDASEHVTIVVDASGEEFQFESYRDQGDIYFKVSNPNCGTNFRLLEYITLDEAYIPDTIARKSDLENNGGGSITVDSTLSSTSTNPVQNQAIYKELKTKQDTLISGVNIKTINGNDIVGSGDVKIEGLPSAIPDWNENNPSAASYIKNRTHYKYDYIVTGDNTGVDYIYDDSTGQYTAPTKVRVTNGDVTSDWITENKNYENINVSDGEENSFGIRVTITWESTKVSFSGKDVTNYYLESCYERFQQLSEEFIPDTIARKSDLENIGGGGSVDSEEITEIKTTLESHSVLIDDLQTMKIDKENDDYYPNMSVGVADQLAGQGEATPSEFTTRQSGGGAILDGTARIEAIKGNSVVWNQLLDTSEYVSHQNGIDVTKDDKNNFVVNGATGDSDAWIKCHKGVFTLVQGHKYLVTGCPKGGSGTTYSLVEGNGIIQPDFGDGRISECSRDIATVMYIVVRKNTTVTNLKYCPLVCDLTKMFGVGNEPTTVEEFNKRMPIEVNPAVYNEGQMINLILSGIKSYSADEEPIERFQDLSLIGTLFPDGMKSAGDFSDEIRYNKDTQKWEKITRIGELSLDSSDLTWYYLSEEKYFITTQKDYLLKRDNVISINSVDFVPLTWSTGEILFSTNYTGNRIDAIALWYNGTDSRLNICCGACQDVDALKEYLKGKKIYYALNEPIVEVLDEKFGLNNDVNVDFNLDYEVWNGGTEEVVPYDEPTTPLRADIVYGFNAYGKIQENSNKIEVLEKNKIVVDSDLNANSDNPISNKLFTNSFTYLGSAIKGVGDDVAALETEVSNKEDKPIEITMNGEPADIGGAGYTDFIYYLNKTNIGLSEEDSYVDYYQKILDGNVVLTAGTEHQSSVNKSVQEDYVTFNVAPQFTEAGIANGSIRIYSSPQTSPNGAEYYVEVRIWLTANSGGGESGGGSNIEVDAELSDTSTNPVQNKAIVAALATKTNESDVNRLIALEHVYFLYKVDENKMYFRGFYTQEWALVIPIILSATFGEPLTPHLSIANNDATLAISTNDFEIDMSDGGAKMTWSYNGKKFSLVFNESGEQIITSQDIDYATTQQLTELSEGIALRNVGAEDTDESVDEPEIPAPTPSASNEWKCVVDRRMEVGERDIIISTFDDGTPLNVQEVLVQVYCDTTSTENRQAYVFVHSSENETDSRYGVFNVENKLATETTPYIYQVYLKASSAWMMAEVMTGVKVATAQMAGVNLSAGDVVPPQIYKDINYIKFAPNGAVKVPPILKIFVR